MCRATVEDGLAAGNFLRPRRFEVRAFYLRLSSCSSPPPPPADLTLVYHPAIGGPALELGGHALPPASPAAVRLLRVRGDAAAYASADRVSAAEGARFEVYAGKELTAEGVFVRRHRGGGGGWRVECRRAGASHAQAVVAVAEVAVLAEGGVLVRGKASASATRGMGCGTRLEGIPEEAAGVGSWGCECGTCGAEWESVAGDDDGDEWKEHEEAVEMETVRWALEMGAWAVCVGVGVGVGLLATARRFRRNRAFR